MSDAPRVVVTGPESSGTRYVAELVSAAGGDVLHRSQPNGTDWIDLRAMLDEPSSGLNQPIPPVDFVVVVVRGRLAHGRSMIARNIECDWDAAMSRRRAALKHIAPILGDDRVTLVTYESLESSEERVHLLQSLGLEVTHSDDVVFVEQNGKHYA